MPKHPAVLDQQRLGRLVGHPDPVGESERDRPLLDHPHPMMLDLLRLRRGKELLPLTVGSRRDRSGSRMLEDQDGTGRRGGKKLIKISLREQLLGVHHREAPPSV